jgi:hypothetical protein
MKRTSIAGAVIVPLSLSLGLLATSARAVTSGAIVRSICPSGAIVVGNLSSYGNDDSWIPVSGSLCGVAVGGSGTADTAFSIPYESSLAESGDYPYVTLMVHGTNFTTGSEVCAVTWAYDSSGNVSSVSNGGTPQCTTGTSLLTQQTLTTNAFSVPANGAVVTLVSAEVGGTVDMLSLTFTVNSN